MRGGQGDSIDQKRFTIARFHRATIALDAQSRSILAFLDDAAKAFDVLSDAPVTWPASPQEAARVRRLVHGLRRELLGERILGPDESVGLDGPGGAVLFRRYPEPGHWRRASLFAASAEVTGSLVRLGEGALLLYGTLTATSNVARGFERVGVEVIRRDIVSVEPRRFRSSAWRETLPAFGTWRVELTPQDRLTVVRLSPEAALLDLVSHACVRPDAAAMKTLASCAEGVPNFAVVAPPAPDRIAVALQDYRGLPFHD